MRLFAIAGLAALPFLAACAPELETRLSLSDIIEVSQTDEMILVPATIRIPQQDNFHCGEAIDRLAADFAAIMPIGKTHCTGNDAPVFFAELATELAIVPAGVNLSYRQAFALSVTASDEGGGEAYEVELFSWRKLEELAQLVNQTTEPLGEPIPAEVIPQITIELAADLPDGALIEFHDVFVDGSPAMSVEDAEKVTDGQTISIQLSDVASAHISEGHAYGIATIYPVRP